LQGTRGKRATWIDGGHLSFGIHAGNTDATEVTDRVITCQFDRQQWIDHLGNGLPPEGYDQGGLSGAPLLTLVENNNVFSWRLGGSFFKYIQPRN
jgi:hypothetical protein